MIVVKYTKKKTNIKKRAGEALRFSETAVIRLHM